MARVPSNHYQQGYVEIQGENSKAGKPVGQASLLVRQKNENRCRHQTLSRAQNILKLFLWPKRRPDAAWRPFYTAPQHPTTGFGSASRRGWNDIELSNRITAIEYTLLM